MLEEFFGPWCTGTCERAILGSLLPMSVQSLMDIVPYRSLPSPVCFQPQPWPPPVMFITSENTHSI